MYKKNKTFVFYKITTNKNTKKKRPRMSVLHNCKLIIRSYCQLKAKYINYKYINEMYSMYACMYIVK